MFLSSNDDVPSGKRKKKEIFIAFKEEKEIDIYNNCETGLTFNDERENKDIRWPPNGELLAMSTKIESYFLRNCSDMLNELRNVGRMTEAAFCRKNILHKRKL